jgi:hypothetical protein
MNEEYVAERLFLDIRRVLDDSESLSELVRVFLMGILLPKEREKLLMAMEDTLAMFVKEYKEL